MITSEDFFYFGFILVLLEKLLMLKANKHSEKLGGL